MPILTNILQVFTSVGQWIAGAFESLMPVFYTPGTGSTEGQLTVIGVLAIAGLAISVSLLIFNIIKSFIRFQ